MSLRRGETLGGQAREGPARLRRLFIPEERRSPVWIGGARHEATAYRLRHSVRITPMNDRFRYFSP